jgi:hypothetical protein
MGLGTEQAMMILGPRVVVLRLVTAGKQDRRFATSFSNTIREEGHNGHSDHYNPIAVRISVAMDRRAYQRAYQ